MTMAELEATDPEIAARIMRHVAELKRIVAEQRGDLDDQAADQ